MIKKRRKSGISDTGQGTPLASNVGAVLLDLHSALRKAERCRIQLRQMGYSEKRWQEIVKDVNPELRFMLRPQILDAIIIHLRSVGHPVNRKTLAQALHAQGAAPLVRIKQTITVHLRSGNLKLFGENKIGLPGWKHKEKRT
jgi:hypothetical protein